MNPLYNQFGNTKPSIAQLAERVKAFQRSFSGNPRDEVQKMLNSGQLSQAQFNRYAQMASQIVKTLNIK